MQKLFIAGHLGMAGSAFVKQLQKKQNVELVCRNKAELDLSDQQAVRDFFRSEKIDQVYLAAAKVGGIMANKIYPAEFIYTNLIIAGNVIHAAHQAEVQKLLFLGSSCIYPRITKQPMTEQMLLTGLLEPTNEPYAIAKIAGIKLCESYNRQYGRDYRSVMPSNLYGDNDNFNLENAHVIPALMHRLHKAKLANDPTFAVWGTGKPVREFLHVDDMAAAAIHVMDLELATYQAHTEAMVSHINIGSGSGYTIKTLATTIARVVGYQGRIEFDASKPDGSPSKIMDVSLLQSLGWKASITLEAGLVKTYAWFVQNQANLRL